MRIWVASLAAIAGVFFIATGILFPNQFDKIMKNLLQEKLVLRADNPMIKNFISPTVPFYIEFYFFNITNVNEILQGEKPKLDEIGPYTYEKKRKKYKLKWTHTTVEYVNNTTFFFRPDLSSGLTEEDMITTLNPVLITLASKLASHTIPEAFHALLEIYRYRFDMGPFITRSSGELLFKGYREDILLALANFTGNPKHKTGKFGFMYPKNNTEGATMKIFTGNDDFATLQLIDEWKGKNKLDFWSDPYCNMINGSAGGQFVPPIVPEKNITLFAGILCRSLYLTFEKKITHGGLELYRYVVPYEVMANRSENQCYCSDHFTCRPSMVDLTPCKNGIPIIMSTPHFYMGSKKDISAVSGLHPNKKQHEIFIDVEPNTGISFRGFKRIQINMPLKRYAAIHVLSNVSEIILPILWVNDRVEVPVEKAQLLHNILTVPVIVVQYTCWSFLCIGLILIILTVFSCIQLYMNNNTKFAMVNEK